EKFHPQVLPDLRFALGLGEPAHRVEVVRLDAIEIVLGLRVDCAEDRVGVGLPVDVGDAPVVADDRDGARLLLPSRRFRLRLLGKCDRRNERVEQASTLAMPAVSPAYALSKAAPRKSHQVDLNATAGP